MEGARPLRTQLLPVKLPSGTVIQVEASVQGERDIAGGFPSFQDATEAIGEIAEMIQGTLTRVRPDKATVELGLDIALEAGHLTALLVKGTGAASLKITLEWEKRSASGASSRSDS